MLAFNLAAESNIIIRTIIYSCVGESLSIIFVAVVILRVFPVFL